MLQGAAGGDIDEFARADGEQRRGRALGLGGSRTGRCGRREERTIIRRIFLITSAPRALKPSRIIRPLEIPGDPTQAECSAENGASTVNLRVSILAAAACIGTAGSGAQTPRRDEASFRDLYRQLVEINTTRSVGSCTQAAEAMRAHLAAAGLPAERRANPRAARTAERRRPDRGPARPRPSSQGPFCCSPTSTWWKPSARTGSATRSNWSRRTVGSTRAARATTRRWRRSSPTA